MAFQNQSQADALGKYVGLDAVSSIPVNNRAGASAANPLFWLECEKLVVRLALLSFFSLSLRGVECDVQLGPHSLQDQHLCFFLR